MLWSIYTQLEPARKAAAFIMRLQGSAREFANNMPPHTVIHGGIVNGVQVEPTSFLMHALAERYAALGEEASLDAMAAFMNFDALPGERVDELLIRFDNVRQRAIEYGQLNLNIQGVTWILLKALHVNENQLLTLLQPFGGRFPQNQAELDDLRLRARRMGHIIENTPGNIASTLRSNNNVGRQGARAFLVGDGDNQNSQQAPTDNGSFQIGENLVGTPAFGGGANMSSNTNSNNVYHTLDDDGGSGTDSDTQSSYGENNYDDLVQGVPQSQIAAHLFWTYTRAKAAWRRYTGKPVRRARRFLRKAFKGKGKGRGKGRSTTALFAELSENDIEEVFYKGKGKGKGKRSSGKGFGRQKNPKGRDGQILKCHECDSEDHLVAQCPRRNGRQGNLTHAYSQQPQQHSSSSLTAPSTEQNLTWMVQASVETGPLDDLLHSQIFMVTPTDPENNNRDPTASGSSQWTIPTDISHTVPTYTPDLLPQESESTGGDSHRSNVWSEHFQDIQNPNFHTPPTNQQYPIPPIQAIPQPTSPPTLLGGQYVRQDITPPKASPPITPPSPPTPPQDVQSSQTPQPIQLQLPKSAPKAVSPGLVESPRVLRTLRLNHFQNSGSIAKAPPAEVIRPIFSWQEHATDDAQRVAVPEVERPGDHVQGATVQVASDPNEVQEADTPVDIVRDGSNEEQHGSNTPAHELIHALVSELRQTRNSQASSSTAPSIPEWANDPQFGNLMGTVPTLPNNLPRPYSSIVNSSLDPLQAADFRALDEVEAEMSRNHGEITVFSEQMPRFSYSTTLDPVHRPFIDDFHDIQLQMDDHRVWQRYRAQRDAKGKNKGRGKGKSQPKGKPSVDPATFAPAFPGTNTECVICLATFAHQDQCVRLACGHVFHSECWHAHRYTSCPVCRGGARVVAHFLFVIPPEDREEPPTAQELQQTVTHYAQTFDYSTPPISDRDEFESVEGSPQQNQMTFPWWIAPDGTRVYHSVMLANGLSIIVDPGAYTNLAGKKWARSQALKATQHKYQVKQEKMRTPLGVSGVGEGSQKCTHQGSIPIAVDQETSAGASTSIHTFECPIVEGTGEDLPALLGLKSMAAKNAILEMTPGKECLIFPGPNGYELNLAPGYTRIPLTKAPSGHLCIPSDQFHNVGVRSQSASSSSGSALPEQQFTLHSRILDCLSDREEIQERQ